MMTTSVIDYISPVPKTNVKLEGVDSKGRKKISIFGEHQSSNLINKNFRIYTEELWEDLLNRKDFLEAQASNRLLGYLGHPDLSKSTQLDYTKFSHYTKNVYKENGVIYATDYPTTSPMGVLLTNYMLEDGIQFGISSRGYGESEQRFDQNLGKYIELMKPGFVLEGWDFVLDPSCYIAFPKVKLESRQYIENWNPVIKVFENTVREYLDDASENPSTYQKPYAYFTQVLKSYPNQAVVKNYVVESLKPIESDLNKKISNTKSSQKVFSNRDLPKEVFENLKKESVSLAKKYNQLLDEYQSSQRIIEAYEKKFDELIKEVNRYRVEATPPSAPPDLKPFQNKKRKKGEDDEPTDDQDRLTDSDLSVDETQPMPDMPPEQDEVQGGNDLAGDLGEPSDAYIDSEQMPEGSDIPIDDSSSEFPDTELGGDASDVKLPISKVKKMNLRGIMELGESLSVLPDEKKQLLVSSMFNNNEAQIKNALYELVEKVESEQRKSYFKSYFEYLQLNRIYKEERSEEDSFSSENSSESVSSEDPIVDVLKMNKVPSQKWGIMKQILLKKESENHNFNSESKKQESSLHIPDREKLTKRTGGTTSNNFLGNERFSDYVESMVLENINSPYPSPSYLLVVKNYEHPASTSHLRKGEDVLYLGYFKGNWNKKLEDIAVLQVSYMLLGSPQKKYVTMPLSKLYEYTVPYTMDKQLYDENLPFSGVIDQEKNDRTPNTIVASNLKVEEASLKKAQEKITNFLLDKLEVKSQEDSYLS